MNGQGSMVDNALLVLSSIMSTLVPVSYDVYELRSRVRRVRSTNT